MAVFQLSSCWCCSQRGPRWLLPYAYCLLLANCCRQSCGHNMSASVYDFPGPVPGGNEESCVSAYRRVAGLDCGNIESLDPRIVVQRCYVEKADAHGVIALYVNASSTNQQVYRVRITGPEVLLPSILYCGHSAAYAEYTVFTPGPYHAEILHLYEDFSYGAPHPALKLHILLAEHDFSIQAAHRITAGHSQCGPALLADGRWVVSDRFLRSFHTTCVSESDTFDACSEAVRTFSTDTSDSHMHWQPNLCPRLARESEIDTEACLSNKRICFSGDSHIRHAHNGFVALSEGRACAAEYWRNFGHNNHTVLESLYSSFQSNVWGDDVATEGCSAVFVNFGQWPASYLSEGRPWSAGRYINKTSELAARLAQARGEGTSVYWVRCLWKHALIQ